jgi:hypothetical protein
MPTLDANFIQTENAGDGVTYAATHGLPKRVIFPNSKPPGTLFLISSRSYFQLAQFKSSEGTGELAIQKDAYLLWRLSERYGQIPFEVGLLDADRVKRLWQLRAIEFVGVGYGATITAATQAIIQWDRMPLREHFVRLCERARNKRCD